MLTIRRSTDRGHADHGWLDARHTFSFAGYHDPRFQGFHALRVLNEDRVQPATGFGTHPHRDMEILTWILSGALEHQDSLGNGSVLRPGDMQRMTAGSGVLHSEVNPSASEPLHLLQIWIEPNRRGLAPSYQEMCVPFEKARNELLLVASEDGDVNGSLTIHQDARVLAARLDAGRSVRHSLGAGRAAWLQVARGVVNVNGSRLGAGDGAAIEQEPRLDIEAESDAEVLVFDLARTNEERSR